VSYLNLDAIAGTLARRLHRRAALVQLAAGAAGLLTSAGRVLAQEATPATGASAFFVLRRYQ
jgi:hypothetical protein